MCVCVCVCVCIGLFFFLDVSDFNLISVVNLFVLDLSFFFPGVFTPTRRKTRGLQYQRTSGHSYGSSSSPSGTGRQSSTTTYALVMRSLDHR